MTDPDTDIFAQLQHLDGPQHVEAVSVLILGLMDNLPIEQRFDILNSLMILHRKVCARSNLDDIAKAIQKHDSAEAFMEWMRFNGDRQVDQIKRQVERVMNLLELLGGRQAGRTVPPRRTVQ